MNREKISQRVPRGWVAAAGVVFVLGMVYALVRPRPPQSAAATPHAEEEHAGHAAGEEGHRAGGVTLSTEAMAAIELETVRVRPQTLPALLTTTGRIIPNEDNLTQVGPRVAGRVVQARVKIGDVVRAGEIIATLDSVDLAQAVAAYHDAQARLDLARQNLERQRRFASAGAFTAGPLEEARKAHAEAKVEWSKALTEQIDAQNELELAEKELERTRRLAEVGAFTTAPVEEKQQALAAAEAELAEAHGDLQIAEAQVRYAQGELERTRRLAGLGELSRGPLETARNEHAQAQAALTQAQAAVSQAERDLARVERLEQAGVAAQKEVLAARTELEQRKAALTQAETRLETATAALQRQQAVFDENIVPQRAIQEVERTLAQAEKEHQKAEATTRQLQQKVSAARATLAREQALAAERLGAESQIQQAETRVALARRALEGERQHVAEAQAKVRVAEEALAREQALHRDQLRARQELQIAENQLAAARIARDNAAEMLRLLGLSPVSLPRGRSGRTIIPIRAPRGGLVIARDMNKGEVVAPEDTLATLLDLGSVYAELNIYEKDLARVREGQKVRVQVQAFPDQVFHGRVTYLSGALDEQTRTSRVRAWLGNPGGRLRPGMFVSASIEVGEEEVLAVPREAVQTVDDDQVVFVRSGPRSFETRVVSIGAATDGWLEIRAGLRSDEEVVSRGAFDLKSALLKEEIGEGHGH